MAQILEAVALAQTRFRAPGVTADARGVMLGQRGLCVFSSLDRAVAFLRGYAEGGALDDLLVGLTIHELHSPLRTREIGISVAAESSHRMDRVASVARLAGGSVFTGTQRHFVRYRDARSPLGYDVVELDATRADVLVYDEAYAQSYAVARDIPFRDLVRRLAPVPVPVPASTAHERVFVVAEVGIGHALLGYLFRWRVRAQVALGEWPAASAFDDGPRRLHVLALEGAPPRVLSLLRALPGVAVFEPIGRATAVEVGYRHPIALDACQSAFEGSGLTFFRGTGAVFELASETPFVPVHTLVRGRVELDGAPSPPRSSAREAPAPMELSLRLAPTQLPWRRVVATVVPNAERPWLSRLLYRLPPRVLASLRMARSEDAVFLLDPAGIEGVPLGRFYSEAAPRVYVPCGLTLVPSLSAAALTELAQDREGGHVFFDPEREAPRVVAADAFGPVAREAIADALALPIAAEAPDRIDPALPLLTYGPPARFPLWGVPGQVADVPREE